MWRQLFLWLVDEDLCNCKPFSNCSMMLSYLCGGHYLSDWWTGLWLGVVALCVFVSQEGPVRGNGLPARASPQVAANREALLLPRGQQLGPAQPDRHPLLRPQLGGHAQGLRAPLPHRRGCGRPRRGHASNHSAVHLYVRWRRRNPPIDSVRGSGIINPNPNPALVFFSPG